MANLLRTLTRLATSPQGKKLAVKAQQLAKDPKTKAQVEKARLKLVQMRSGSGGGASDGTTPDGPPKAP